MTGDVQVEDAATPYWTRGWAALYDDMDEALPLKAVRESFYANLVDAETESLLDLGCGTGSITSIVAGRLRPTAQRGPVTGVDLSDAMIAVAAGRHPTIDWRVGDLRRPPVTERYDLILCCFHTLQALLTDEDLAEAFSAVRDALTETGRFAFDIYQPNLVFLGSIAAGKFQDGQIVRRFSDKQGRAYVVRESAVAYDADKLTLTGSWRLHDAETDARLPLEPLVQTLRQYFPNDIERHLTNAGLRLRERYGDLDKSPFTPSSIRQVIVCERA